VTVPYVSRSERREGKSAKPPTGKCGRCGSRLKPIAKSKAAHAAVTSAMLHEALKQCGVQHAVAGYTTGSRSGVYDRSGQFSRSSATQSIRVFVEAPGMSTGSPLTHISGYGANLDGESLMWALKYAATKFADCDRVIILMISDGLPAGADDSLAEDAYLHDVVQLGANAGIEVYAIGVGVSKHTTRVNGVQYDSAYDYFYPQSRGKKGQAPTGHILLPPTGLTDTVLKEITKLITRGFGQSRKGKLG